VSFIYQAIGSIDGYLVQDEDKFLLVNAKTTYPIHSINSKVAEMIGDDFFLANVRRYRVYPLQARGFLQLQICGVDDEKRAELHPSGQFQITGRFHQVIRDDFYIVQIRRNKPRKGKPITLALHGKPPSVSIGSIVSVSVVLDGYRLMAGEPQVIKRVIESKSKEVVA
jgi:hypothetical protein